MNFLIAGVIAPIAYFLIRYIVKRFVMSLIASAKTNSNVKICLVGAAHCGGKSALARQWEGVPSNGLVSAAPAKTISL